MAEMYDLIINGRTGQGEIINNMKISVPKSVLGDLLSMDKIISNVVGIAPEDYVPLGGPSITQGGLTHILKEKGGVTFRYAEGRGHGTVIRIKAVKGSGTNILNKLIRYKPYMRQLRKIASDEMLPVSARISKLNTISEFLSKTMKVTSKFGRGALRAIAPISILSQAAEYSRDPAQALAGMYGLHLAPPNTLERQIQTGEAI